MPAIPIIVVEDHRASRDRIATTLRAEGLGATFSVHEGDDVAQRVRELRPRVVLMDAGVVRRHGAAYIDTVRKAHDGVFVIVCDLEPDSGDIAEFARAGATGFVMRNASATELVSAVRAVADGRAELPPALAGALLAHLANERLAPRYHNGGHARLTQREREVGALIADGCSNKEIAAELHIAIDTVKSHVHSILKKLGLRTRLQIASYAHHGADGDGLAAPDGRASAHSETPQSSPAQDARARVSGPHATV